MHGAAIGLLFGPAMATGDAAIFWVPFATVEVTFAIIVFQEIDSKADTFQRAPQHVIRVEHLVIVSARTRATRPNKLDIVWIRMISVGDGHAKSSPRF